MPTLPCRLAKIILPFEPPDAPVPGFKIIFPPLPPVIAPLPPLPAVTVTVPPVPPLLILIPLLPPLPATKVNGPPAPPLPELFEPLPVVNEIDDPVETLPIPSPPITTKAGTVVVALALTTAKAAEGVELPIPTLPLAKTVNKDVPDDDETLNGLSVPVPLMLKLTVEEVALTPTTVPLLSKDEAEVNVPAEVK